MFDVPDADKSVPGGGVIAGIGFVSGVRCMVSANDSGIDAGALQPYGLDKTLRVQELALENKLPYVQLVESAGANLLRYRVEDFVRGGNIFRNLARLSAAGLPVVTVTHGSSTAGGAYQTGLSDYIVMVRGRTRAFLAGPPLLKAATGEIATEEELGGAEMHTTISGLGDYLAEDDRDALRIARDIMANLEWDRPKPAEASYRRRATIAEELLGIMPMDHKRPVDMRQAIARFIDDSDFTEFGANYGPATVCGHARIEGQAIGIITNNGPLDVPGANKATHFIQACCQSRTPLLYLNNTTGYMVGKAYEEAGMIKHGSKMIQAVTSATVPQITIYCGASFGAGNYGMCGRGFHPRFCFSWPNARTAVMGGEQAAETMAIVTEAAAVTARQADREGKDRRHEGADHRRVRRPDGRVLDQRPRARRRRDRSARYPRRAERGAGDLPRGRGAQPAAHAILGRAAMSGKMKRTPFFKILIANRGEIALRIMRTARRLGYGVVAVYSDADRDALHVREADQAVRIGDALPAQSYLSIEAIIAAAKASGADAVHPGYGFLAENADFAQACCDAGLVFIGPSPEAIRAMGNKAGAKDIMQKAGVPCVPGYQGADQSDGVMLAEASKIGFPVMIKAVAGGGGRGMRLVADAAAISGCAAQRALRGARRVRRRQRDPGARDRRSAPHRDPGVRRPLRQCRPSRRARLLGAAAAPEADRGSAVAGGVARNCGRGWARSRSPRSSRLAMRAPARWSSCSTASGEFYFMEMNTRLQVEHPVTEAITGLDLVELQLRVAAGEPLGLVQEDIKFSGHAIEVRLCSEDAVHDFMPQSGTDGAVADAGRHPRRARAAIRLRDSAVLRFDDRQDHQPWRQAATRRGAS